MEKNLIVSEERTCIIIMKITTIYSKNYRYFDNFNCLIVIVIRIRIYMKI